MEGLHDTVVNAVETRKRSKWYAELHADEDFREVFEALKSQDVERPMK